jgi:membrane protease YdiL (CAAX protease family)
MVKGLQKVGFGLFWVVWLMVCYFVAQLVIFATIELLPIEIQSDDTLALAFVSALVYMVTLAVLVVVPYQLRERLKLPPKLAELVGLGRKIAASDLTKAIGTFLIYLAVLIGVMSVFSLFFPELSEQEQNLGFEKSGNNLGQLVLIFISLVVVPPVCEEMIMRGFLFGRLRTRLSFWPVAIIVSAVFALAHGQINVAVDTFVLSLFLCHLREKTGAVWSPMIVHMLKNLLGFMLVFVVVV